MTTEREEEELRRQEEITRQQKLAEQKRLELEQEERERERQRHENERQQMRENVLKEKMQQISQTAHGKKVLKKLDEEEIKKLDAKQIVHREAEELVKERKEMVFKLKLEKKVDYFEQAKRQEEFPLINQFLANKQVDDKEFWETQEKQRIENAIAERKISLTEQERLKRLHVDRDAFVARLRSERSSTHEEKVIEFEKNLKRERIKRIAQRVVDRREQRKSEYYAEIEAEKKRIEDEERRVREEEEREERIRLQRERDAEAERRDQIEQAKREEMERKTEERKVQEQKEKDASSSWRTAEKPTAAEKYKPPSMLNSMPIR